LQSSPIALESEHDIIIARSVVRGLAARLGFRLIDQTRLVTVTSELARNVVKYAQRGRMLAQPIDSAQGRAGLRLIFEDNGPATASRRGTASAKGSPAPSASWMFSRLSQRSASARA
jgi:serine/threonine-protein kinase RsbT